MDDGLFTNDFIVKALNMKSEELEPCVEYLEQKGYVKVVRVEVALSVPAIWGINLTHKGRHYGEFTRISIKRFLLDNIFAIIALIISIIALIKQ